MEPRLISLEYSTHDLDTEHPPTSAYLLGGPSPYLHFMMDAARRPPEPYRTGHIFPPDESLTALALNQESREFFLSLGYRPWTLKHPRLGTKDIMWCPAIDTVLFPTMKPGYDGGFSDHYVRRCFDIFIQHYSAQAAQILRVAFQSSYWPQTRQFAIDLGLFLTEFANMEEIVVVLNETHEKNCVIIEKTVAHMGQTVRGPWTVPRAIKDSLRGSLRTLQLPTHDGKRRKAPSVRIVWSEGDIMSRSGSEHQWALRCYPCEYFPSVQTFPIIVPVP